MVCHLIHIAQEIFVGMGIGTVKRITVMADVGTDVIITTTIIETTHHPITHSQASGETVVEADLLEVAEQDDIPQATRIVGAEVRVVAEVQVDILPALPAAAAASLTMIVALPVAEVIPAVVDHQVVEVAPAVAAERVDTK